MPTDMSATERAYRRLKTDILDGRLGAGPLDIRTLADHMHMSATPVREALARLFAERLVQLAPHHGYAIAIPSVRRLRHLYELNGALLDLCLHFIGQSSRPPPAPDRPASAADYVSNLAQLSKWIAVSQPNIELSDRIGEIGDRLAAARRCEPDVFPGAIDSLTVLIALWEIQDFKALRELLRTHHATRAARAETLVSILTDKGESG